MSPRDLALINHLSGFITEHKLSLFDSVLSKRTKFLTVVLEDIFQPQNASAVVRSCDCFGIQDLHVIENTNEYVINPNVTLGSAKWVDIYRYNDTSNNTEECIRSLRKQGYSIVATTPSEEAEDLADFQLNEKSALFFGTELTGLSETVMSGADRHLRIPMYGFTESFNISVSAAIVLFALRNKLDKSSHEFLLTEEEKLQIKLSWMKKVIKRADKYIEEFENSWDEKTL